MKLIVGLGNPGKEYINTRHNIGFMILDDYLSDKVFKKKFEGQYYYDQFNQIIYLKPLSYMNNSGMVVYKFVNYFKIPIQDILVIYDDMDFEVGKFKIKLSGSSAGHNGMNSIIEYLNTYSIRRIKVGIGRPDDDKIDYVLGKFSKTEMTEINNVIKQVKNVLDDYKILSFINLMNKYNRE